MTDCYKDRSPRFVGYLSNGMVENNLAKPQHRCVSLVMGAVGLQDYRSGSDSTFSLKSPGGRVITLMLDGAPRTFRRLHSKLPDFPRETRISLDGSEDIRGTQRGPLDVISSWVQDFPSRFTFIASDGELALLSWDTLGIKQVYLGEKEDAIGFATDENFLHRLGFTQLHALKFGSCILLSKHGVTRRDPISLPYQGKSREDLHASAEELLKALFAAISEEVSGFDRVGVAFSGGIDSSIIAKIASTTGIDVILYASGVAGANDLLFAEKAAGWLGLPLVLVPLSLEGAEADLSKIISILGTSSVMELSIELPVYATIRSMRDDGLLMALSGQGADELFGGYFRHLLAFREGGYPGLSRSLRQDMVETCAQNVMRERAIARSARLELLSPYLDLEVLRVGLNISPELKVLGSMDLLRKAVLRESGHKLNLPDEIVYRKKKAVQYGSGSLKIMRQLAKKKGYTVSEYLLSLQEKNACGNA